MKEVFINNINIKFSSKIADWKSNKKLSDLIMSEFNPISEKEAEIWITKNTNMYDQVLKGIFIKEKILGKETVSIVGVCRLMFIDFESKVCELGMYIGDESHRGIGIGQKAINALLDIAFNELTLRKVFLKVRSSNVSAINLYSKIGFEIEGELKQHFKTTNGFESILYMAIFKDIYTK